MNTSARKAKGHRLEKQILKLILDKFPELGYDDLRITVGSETGSDIKLSAKALRVLPFKIEAKSRAKIAIYSWMAQAEKHEGKFLEPLLVVKQNRCKPLVCLDLEYFLELYENSNRR